MNKISKKISIILFAYILCFSALFSPVCAVDKNIGFLLTDRSGNVLLEKNKDSSYIPASILKIVTSLAAIHYLGENYQYQTYFYFNKQNSNLYVKGFGDPIFISEEIKKACAILSNKLNPEFDMFEQKTINNIILDHSFFEPRINIPGKSSTLNPYDASSGALCANFNTIFFKTDKFLNKYISAEKQTPLLSVFFDKISNTGLERGRITLSKKESMLYPGQLIKYFLGQEGIKVSGKIKTETVDKKEETFLIYTSDIKLTQIVQNLLQYSNNFIANQLLLTMGACYSSPPSNLKKSVAAVNFYLSDNFKNITIKYVEGSGISRKNRLSCNDMMKVLKNFIPHHKLLKTDDSKFYKTGTLAGIRTIAGFIKGKNKALYPFVIMINKKNKSYNDILKKMETLIRNL